MTSAELISEERKRQIENEGFDAEHDSKESFTELSRAAMAYIVSTIDGEVPGATYWPWGQKYYKQKTPRKNLIRAGALIAAAIDRLDSEINTVLDSFNAELDRRMQGMTEEDLQHMGLESFYGTIGSGSRSNAKSHAWISGFYYALKHFKHLSVKEQRKRL